MMDTRALQRIDNKITPRHVTGWTLTGASYKRGRRIPGYLHLTLEGGGYLYYPETTTLPQAIDDAADRGFDTAEVRRRTAAWVETGTY